MDAGGLLQKSLFFFSVLTNTLKEPWRLERAPSLQFISSLASLRSSRGEIHAPMMSSSLVLHRFAIYIPHGRYGRRLTDLYMGVGVLVVTMSIGDGG